MEPQDILSQAAAILHRARAEARWADLEETVREFEQSTVPALRSLARAYRMLQRPFA